MAKPAHGLTKRALISKANKRTVVVTSFAVFIFIFTAVATNALVKEMLYQNRVISARKDALQVAEASRDAVRDLETSYKAFTSTPQNLIGGNPSGTGDRDGDNAKIILDALPPRYDYPALTTSLEKIVTSHGLQFVSMIGNDDAIAQQENTSSATPAPVEMPFEFSVKGDYDACQDLVKSLEQSIRPFQIQAVELLASTGEGDVTIKVIGKTFFQPAKNLNVNEETVQ